jgi:hypothetical protein
MVPAVASEPLQDHSVLHASLTAESDPIRDLINAAEYARLLATPRLHLGHEGQRISLAPVIKGRENLFTRAYLHELSGPQVKLSLSPTPDGTYAPQKRAKGSYHKSTMPFTRTFRIWHSSGFETVTAQTDQRTCQYENGHDLTAQEQDAPRPPHQNGE